jgi:hypothetical protein
MDHGMTWRTLSYDFSDADELLLTELGAALEGAVTARGLQGIDLVGLDMCLAGTFEAAAELHEVCGVLVASAEPCPAIGWNYANYVGFLRASPTATARQLGSCMVEGFESICEEAELDRVSLIAFDLTNAPLALGKFEDAVARLRTEMPSQYLRLSFTRSCVDTYDDNLTGTDTVVDIGDLLYVLRHVSGDIALQSDIDAFFGWLGTMVVRSYCPPPHQYSTGLSIFFPKDSATFDSHVSLYSGLSLAGGTSWDETLPDYYTAKGIHSSSIACSGTSITDTVVSTISPVTVTADISGDFIADVDFYVCRIIGAQWRVYQVMPVHNWRQLPNGRKIENWHSQTAWSLSDEWDARCLLISDGSVKSPVEHAFFEGEYWLKGEYSTDSGASWFECRAVFDENYGFSRFLDSSVSIPTRITPVSGDLFRPIIRHITVSTGEMTYTPGAQMDALSLTFSPVPVEPGNYVLTFAISDSVISRMYGEAVTVE